LVPDYDSNVLIKKIDEVLTALSTPLSDEEAADGWTKESKSAILKFFHNLRERVVNGEDIPYVGLVRGLDAWGIERGGDLYKNAMEIARELNAKSK
jgi:hypothetical protein